MCFYTLSGIFYIKSNTNNFCDIVQKFTDKQIFVVTNLNEMLT